MSRPSTLVTAPAPNVAEPDDRFGWTLAAGDFNGDGRSDLGVGVPGESVGPGIDPAVNAGPEDAGAIIVLEGTVTGLSDQGAEAWHQATPALAGLADRAEIGVQDLHRAPHARAHRRGPGLR